MNEQQGQKIQQMRRGRRQREHQDESSSAMHMEPERTKTDALSNLIPATNIRKNWTRSLSPLRTVGDPTVLSFDVVSGESASQQSRSVTHGMVDDTVHNSLTSAKRQIGRSARSQSPRPRPSLAELNMPTDVRKPLQNDSDNDRNETRSTLDKLHRKSPPSQLHISAPGKSRIRPQEKPKRTLSDSAKHRSNSPRKGDHRKKQGNDDRLQNTFTEARTNRRSGNSEKYENPDENYDGRSSTGPVKTKAPPKPASDPGVGNDNRSAQKHSSFKITRGPSSQRKITTSHKPPSNANLASSSHHEKPSSDPGRYGTTEETNLSKTNIASSSSSSSLQPPARVPHTVDPITALTVDKVPRPTAVIDRRNLNKESLQHVADVKESIRKMRTKQYSQRHKGNMDGSVQQQALSDTIAQSKSAPLLVTPSVTSAAIASSPRANPDMDDVAKAARNENVKHTSPQTFGGVTQSTSVRLQGLTVDDLEIGPTAVKRMLVNEVPPSHQEQPRRPSIELQQRHQERIESLTRSIRKNKKLIKRCCQDVWAERDEIVFLQRTNWGIRKALLQTDATEDSITTLNLKIEKMLRQERQLTEELDEFQDEKHQLELECSRFAKSIEEFKNLLDALNTQVVPLFPPDIDDGDYATDADSYRLEGATATAAVIDLLDADDFADSIHSTD